MTTRAGFGFWLGSGCALALAVLLGGCRIGSADVPIGADWPSTFYVAPAGDDSNAGSSRDKPWKTLAHATAKLRPGQTLELLSGDYTLETTGLLSVDCSGAPRNGQPGAPIIVRAETERGARLHGDGAAAPLDLSACSNWVVEGLTLMNEHNPNVAKGTDVGSVAMIRGGHDLTLRRLLMQRSNAYRHTHILRVLEAARVLVEDCETYDFYHNAFETVRSFGVAFRRNYFHSRSAMSVANTVSSDDPTRGDIAIQVEESSSALLENNVAEDVVSGFSIVGRAVGSVYTEPSPYPVSGARLYGNLVRDATLTGFKVETRCDQAMPCTAPERIVSDTLLVNGVALQATTGVSIDAAPATRVDNMTLVDVTNGVTLTRGVGNLGLEFSASAARTLVRGYSAVGFGATTAASDWSFEHCAAFEPASDAVAFSPTDAHVRFPTTTADDDACVAYLGPRSLLRGAAGADGDIGANVIFRSVDGVQTTEPLWDPRTGAFPCGAIVPGINDDPSQSCSGVHERLRIGTPECALPDTKAL